MTNRREFLQKFGVTCAGIAGFPAIVRADPLILNDPVLLDSGVTAAPLDPIWLGLNAYWKLDEVTTGAIRVDSTGNSHHLTDTSKNITGTTGTLGGCADCLTANSTPCLQVPDCAALAAGLGVSFSVSTWIKSAGGANQCWLGKNNNSTLDWSLRCNGSNNLELNVKPIGLGVSNIVFNQNLTNAWQNYVVTFDASTSEISGYCNGVLKCQSNLTANVQRSNISFALFNYGDSHAASISGLMDDTAYWGRCLTPTEVTHLYNGGSGISYPGSIPPLTIGQQWATRVVFNGGALPGNTTISALDTLWNGLVSNSLTSKIVTLNGFAPDNLIAALTPFIIGSGSDPWINHGFTSGDLSINGLVGNGSNYIDTGVNALASFGLSSTGIFYYVYSGSSDSVVDWGVIGPGTTQFLGRSGATNFYDQNGNPGTNVVNTSNLGNGLYIGNRTSATDHRGYIFNSTHSLTQLGPTDTVTESGSLPNFTSYLYAYNTGGSGPNAISSSRISFHAITKGMNATDVANFAALIQAFRTSIGGGFV